MPIFAPVRQQRWRLLWVLLLLFILSLLGVLGQSVWQSQHQQRSDNAYLKADVVWLTAPISGELTALAVREQQQVAQGAVVAVIEDTERASRDTQLNALTALKTAALDIHQQTESAHQLLMEGLRREQRVAQQALAQLSQAQQRQKILLQAGLVAAQSVDILQAQLDTTAARIGSLNASIQAAERQQQSLLNRRAQLEQELQLARQTAVALPVGLGQAKITAPITGRISSLSAQPNSRVTQGTRLMALTAPDSLYVEAWFDEPQVITMQVGQPVEIQLDAYPEQVLQGYITQLRTDQVLPPLQNSLIRRLPVRIALLDASIAAMPADSLRAGLAASVQVDLRNTLRYPPQK